MWAQVGPGLDYLGGGSGPIVWCDPSQGGSGKGLCEGGTS